MWPFALGQIHTSRQAGGMASERMRRSSLLERTRRPSGLT